jgi:hypothetical protein
MVESSADITKPWKELLGKFGEKSKFDNSVQWKGFNAASGVGFTLKSKILPSPGTLTGLELKGEYKDKANNFSEVVTLKPVCIAGAGPTDTPAASGTLELTKDEFNGKAEVDRTTDGFSKVLLTGNFLPAKGLRFGASINAKAPELPVVIGGGFVDPDTVSVAFEAKLNANTKPGAENQLSKAAGGAASSSAPQGLTSVSATVVYNGFPDIDFYGSVSKAFSGPNQISGHGGFIGTLNKDVTGAVRVAYDGSTPNFEGGLSCKLDKATTLNPRVSNTGCWAQLAHEVNDRTKVSVAAGVSWEKYSAPSVGVQVEFS